MKTVTSLLVLSAIFGASVAYADNFHVQNRAKTDLIASVYLNGKLETTRTLQPGQEYVHSFWHNLVVNVQLRNPKTGQICGLAMSERIFSSGSFLPTIYEPKVIYQYSKDSCRWYSSFKQSSWATRTGPAPAFSTVDVWAPWS